MASFPICQMCEKPVTDIVHTTSFVVHELNREPSMTNAAFSCGCEVIDFDIEVYEDEKDPVQYIQVVYVDKLTERTVLVCREPVSDYVGE